MEDGYRWKMDFVGRWEPGNVGQKSGEFESVFYCRANSRVPFWGRTAQTLKLSGDQVHWSEVSRPRSLFAGELAQVPHYPEDDV